MRMSMRGGSPCHDVGYVQKRRSPAAHPGGRAFVANAPARGAFSGARTGHAPAATSTSLMEKLGGDLRAAACMERTRRSQQSARNSGLSRSFKARGPSACVTQICYRSWFWRSSSPPLCSPSWRSSNEIVARRSLEHPAFRWNHRKRIRFSRIKVLGRPLCVHLNARHPSSPNSRFPVRHRPCPRHPRSRYWRTEGEACWRFDWSDWWCIPQPPEALSQLRRQEFCGPWSSPIMEAMADRSNPGSFERNAA
ncbi:hypothetical protein ILFOPFJJ_04601 [Ensifer psoraleae]|nr:hypothetical protein [Sinorhizobium psoraleae]